MYRIRTIVLTLISGVVVVALSAGPAAANAIDASADLGAGVSGVEMATDPLCGSLDVTADGRCDENDAGALGGGGSRPGASFGPDADDDPSTSIPDPCGEDEGPGRGLPGGVADGPLSGGDVERQTQGTLDYLRVSQALMEVLSKFKVPGTEQAAQVLDRMIDSHEDFLEEVQNGPDGESGDSGDSGESGGSGDSDSGADSSADDDDPEGEGSPGEEVDDSWLEGSDGDDDAAGAGEEAGQPAFGEQPCPELGDDDKSHPSEWVVHYFETGNDPLDFDGDFDCDSPAEGQAQGRAEAGDENQGCPNGPDKSHQAGPPCGAEPGHGADAESLGDCIGEFDDDGCSSDVQPSVAPCDGLRLPGGGSGGAAQVGELETPIDEIVDPCINAYCDGEATAASTQAADDGQNQAGIDAGPALGLVSLQLDEIPASVVMELGSVDGPAPGSW